MNRTLKRRATRDVVEWVSMLARLLRSGSTLHAALHEVAHRHPRSLAHDIVIALKQGSTLSEAVASVLPDNDDERLVQFVLRLATDLGGDVPAQIDSLLDTLGDRANARRDRVAHASTALASTRLLTVLPIVATVFIVADDHRMLHTYVSTSAGLACLIGGLVLNLCGRLWTRRLITNA